MKKITYTKFEISLLLTSLTLICMSHFMFSKDYLTLISSIIGVLSLILNAKGIAFGQVLMVLFSCFYAIIAYTNNYYGEMITYLFMTMPMAIFSFISWVKNPYKDYNVVKVRKLSKKNIIIIFFCTIIITLFFYYVLEYFNTNNLVISTISVATSFLAVSLTFLRSPYYALGYACNDIVLIILWVDLSVIDRSYISVVICFIVFLINDIYGYFSWKNLEKTQLDD